LEGAAKDAGLTAALIIIYLQVNWNTGRISPLRPGASLPGGRQFRCRRCSATCRSSSCWTLPGAKLRWRCSTGCWTGLTGKT